MFNLKPNKNLIGKYYVIPHIIKFKNYREYISDNDIFDLFVGLINLVKKSAELKVEDKYTAEINKLKKELYLLKSQK